MLDPCAQPHRISASERRPGLLTSRSGSRPKISSQQPAPIQMSKHQNVLPHALAIPALNKLSGKRIVLASASPRRREIVKIFVSPRNPTRQVGQSSTRVVV